MTCPQTTAVGAYVLGALDPGEQLGFERHLEDCAKCRDGLLQFAPLPGLLHTVTLEDVTDPGLDLAPASPLCLPLPPPAPVRRTSRWSGRLLIAAAVAVVVVLAGGLFGRQLIVDDAPPTQSESTWSTTDGVGGIDVSARLTNEPWGTGIQLRMKDLRPGERCKLVVHGRNGATEVTGWWTTNYAREADVPASTSLPLAGIARLDVVTDDNTVLTSLTDPDR